MTSTEDKINVWYLWENKRGMFSKHFPFCAKSSYLALPTQTYPRLLYLKLCEDFVGIQRYFFAGPNDVSCWV